MSDIVFLGPSLAVDQAARLLPGAEFRPPVEHRDLLRLDVGPGDRVLLIDGLFMHAAPVRHREILGLLERGVVVAGASSMGALRAAELHRFGMRGVGTVFELYRSGVVTGDDEVAVVHGPAEEGYRCLSEPLVNIRVALDAAAQAGAITPAEAGQLLDLARDLPFRSRGYRTLARTATDPGSRAAVERFLAWQQRNQVDAKQADARLLLSLAATGPDALLPAGPDDLPIKNVQTRHYATWVARHRGWPAASGQWVTEAEVAAALIVLHPRYPELHRRDTLRRLLGEPDDRPGLEQRALAFARERGLLAGAGGDARYGGGWLTDAERAGLPAAEATLRLLVRAFGSGTHKRISLELLPPALTGEPLLTRARKLVATAQALTERLPRSPVPSAGRLRLRPASVAACFAELWGCPADDMEAAGWDRGFADLNSFWRAAEPFVLYCRAFGAPDFAAASPAPSAA